MITADISPRPTPPSGARLFAATVLALALAAALLVTVVLPSEYAIDPTGVGRLLGLGEMGEIKQQLAREAEADRRKAPPAATAARPGSGSPETERLQRIERRLDEIARALAMLQAAPPANAEQTAGTSAEAAASRREPEPAPRPAPAAPRWRDEIEIVLQPGEGVEFKLVMAAGAEAAFEWSANGSVLNHDTHGDGGGNAIAYEKGRGVPGQAGILRAAFDGNHGWFWRNRTTAPVTLSLRTRGDYTLLKRTV